MPKIVYDTDADGEDVSVEVAFTKGAGLDQHVREILETAEIKEKIGKTVTEASPYLYYRDGNDVMEDSFASKLLTAFLRNGDKGDVSEVIIESYRGDDYYAQLRADYFENQEWHDRLKDTAARALGRSHRTADVEGAFEDALEEAIVTALQDADGSDPLETIHSGTAVDVVYVPDLADVGSVEDMFTSHSGVSSSALSVIPNEHFARVLRFLNVSSDDYKRAVKDIAHHDLDADPDPDRFDKRQADYRFQEAARIARQWRELDVVADLARPALLSTKDMLEVMDNASYGGVPIVFFRTSLTSFMDAWGQEGTHLELAADDRASGHPQAGLQDFVNGSGHIVSAQTPLFLPKVPGNFAVDGGIGWYGVDSVYGFVKSAVRAQVTSADAPHPSLQLANGPRV